MGHFVRTINDLRNYNGTDEFLYVLGYHAQGDGGGGPFYFDTSSTERDDGGLVIQSNSALQGHWKRLYDAYLNVKWFGAKGDGVTDDGDAFNHAIDAAGPTDSAYGTTILVPPAQPKRTYRLGNDLIINRNLILRGLAGTGNYGASRLTLDDGKHIVIKNINPNNPGGRNGGHSTLADLYIDSISDKWPEEPDPDRPRETQANRIPNVPGVLMQATAHIEHCFIVGFSGHGIEIVGAEYEKIDGNPNPLNENSNGWSIRNSRSENNRGWGLYVHGYNTNGGVCMGLNCISNGEGGIWDSSFHGCTYIGCLAEANLYPSNPGIAYNIDGSRNRTTLIGCYSEGDLRPSFLQDLGIAIGGEHGAQVGLPPGYHPGFSPDSRGLRIRGAGYVTPMTIVREIMLDNQVVSKDELQLGYLQGTAIFGWRRNRFLREQNGINPENAWTNPDEFRLRYDEDPQWWELLRSTDTYFRFIERDVSNVPIISFPLGYRFGGPYSKRVTVGVNNNIPALSNMDALGDKVYFPEPQPGGYEGCICAQAPPPGSNNKTWIRFGRIEDLP
jgi:Pectate lyase superfamily protein